MFVQNTKIYACIGKWNVTSSTVESIFLIPDYIMQTNMQVTIFTCEFWYPVWQTAAKGLQPDPTGISFRGVHTFR